MDEKRKFFRIRNRGEMHACIEDNEIHIIDLSACSAAITPGIELPHTGIMELKINMFKINLNYELLRVDKEKAILIFNDEEHIAKLLAVLKNLRREQV